MADLNQLYYPYQYSIDFYSGYDEAVKKTGISVEKEARPAGKAGRVEEMIFSPSKGWA